MKRWYQPKVPDTKDWSVEQHAEAQKKLLDNSASAMSIQYCREDGGSELWKKLRRYTVDCNFDFKRWKRYQKASRNMVLWTPRNVLRGDNIRRLLVPDMAVIGGFAASVSYYNSAVLAQSPELAVTTMKNSLATITHPGFLTLPLECLTVTSMTLGLLVTFHTRTCYDRFDDARGQWGLIINESRAFASRILNRLPSHNGADEKRVLKERKCAVKLIQSFPHTLKYHVTEDGCNPHINTSSGVSEAVTRAALNTALRAELQTIWDMTNEHEASIVEQILAPEAGNRPMLVLHMIGHINGDVFASPFQGNLDSVVASDMDRSLQLFHHILGRCERILRTPVYTPYTKFSSRFLYLWCLALPLGMYPMLGPLATFPVCSVAAFFMLGIQDMGSRVEQPFDSLPLWQYCQTIDQSCEQLLRHAAALQEEAKRADAECDGFGWGGDEDSFGHSSLAEFDELDPDSLRSFVDPL